MQMPGMVSTSFTSRSILGTVLKAALSCGSEGDMVAPAITVRLLVNNRVNLISGKFLFMQAVGLGPVLNAALSYAKSLAFIARA